jgi:hypothetical protein
MTAWVFPCNADSSALQKWADNESAIILKRKPRVVGVHTARSIVLAHPYAKVCWRRPLRGDQLPSSGVSAYARENYVSLNIRGQGTERLNQQTHEGANNYARHITCDRAITKIKAPMLVQMRSWP